MKKAPKDQGLFLTVFASVSVVAILIVWAFLPVVHIQTEEGDDEEVQGPPPRVNINLVLPPEELMEKSIVAIKKAEKVIEMDDKKKEEEEKGGEKKSGEKTDGGNGKKDAGGAPKEEKAKG
jgi:hypothetical protein